MPVLELPRASSRSRYGDDSDSDSAYVRIPVPLAAGRGGSRRGSTENTYNTNFLVPANSGPRRRAASTSGSPQPIYIVNGAGVEDDRRSRRSSGGSDRSRRSSSRYGYDRDEVRRELEYERRRDELRNRSRERERRREYERIQDEIEAAKRREKRDRERMEDEIEERKRKDAIQRQKILDDAKADEEKKKREKEEYRKKILEEEEEKERKKKKEKEEQDKKVEDQMRAKFKALGYSDSRIEELMKGKKREWAIDLSRPTYIKVNRKYLLPDTLDYYQLPWEWDKNNSEYIVIKRYIDDDFQEVLFEHTRTIKTKRKVITSGYEKDVTVTLRPRQEVTEVVKDRNDNMYLVRSKSRGRERSSSRRRSWIFT